MTDYKEEQDNEMEALESIYVTELEVVERGPYVFIITVDCTVRQIDVALGDKEFQVGLRFLLPEEYPDVPPDIEFAECGELDEDMQRSLIIELNKRAEEELGCVMVFTLVQELQDRVNDWADNIYNKQVEEKEEREKVPEFFGTRVTKENFLEWRRKFVLERNCNKVVIETDKLSGRQIFNLKGAEAMKIEVELLSNEGLLGDEEDVEVDESLFNEIEDFSDSEEESG